VTPTSSAPRAGVREDPDLRRPRLHGLHPLVPGLPEHRDDGALREARDARVPLSEPCSIAQDRQAVRAGAADRAPCAHRSRGRRAPARRVRVVGRVQEERWASGLRAATRRRSAASGAMPAAVIAGSSWPMKRTIGWSVVGSVSAGTRGFCSHSSRPSSVVGGSVRTGLGVQQHSLHTMARQHCIEPARPAGREERRVAHFHGPAPLCRPLPQRGVQHVDVVGPERRRQLQREAADRSPSGAISSQKAASSDCTLAQSAIVCDPLWHLEHEAEVGCACSPSGRPSPAGAWRRTWCCPPPR
jgi:hypothetical protein